MSLGNPRVGAPPKDTLEEARAASLRGWNLRCNRCGRYGALWYPEQRPGWGSLAQCDPCADELFAEIVRHNRKMAELRTVHYEQDRRLPDGTQIQLPRKEGGYRP